VTYVSTAYVAGDRRGTAYEDDRETGAFRNSYERSKHEAEALVRSSTLPWTIARPSIVVGESTTGWTASFNVLYGPLRAFDAGAYPLLPARRRSPVDVVCRSTTSPTRSRRSRTTPRRPGGPFT
jgi:long-chain acyl-CoA synthetase